MQKSQDGEDHEQLDDQVDLSESHVAPLWLVEMRRSMMRGFYHSLGEHALAFMDRGSPDLVVSFDNLSSARDEAVDRGPWGYGFAAKNGFSHLGVMAFRPSWFRDDELFSELRRLAESGFFRRFASVTMTGTSMGGYAACAFAALVPGCRVLAFSPQSTLKKSLVPWEERFSSGRKADWSGEFADAAASSAAAGRVWLIYDPLFAPDLRHAQRFTHANARFLPARYSGHKSALFLRRAGILSTVVRQAVRGDLTVAGFFNSYRLGRTLPWYVHGMAERLIEKRQPRLMARMVAAMRTTHAAPLPRIIEGKGRAAGLLDTAKPQANARAPEPTAAEDLYMSSPDLPAPLPGPGGIWTQFDAPAASGLPWQGPKR